MSKKQNIQEKVDKLDKLIKHFEGEREKFNLEEDLKVYEEALQIVNEIQNELESFELKIKEIKTKYEDSDQEGLV